MVDGRQGSGTAADRDTSAVAAAAAAAGREHCGGVADRLHIALNQHLCPIRGSLDATGRSLAGLNEQFAAMEATLSSLFSKARACEDADQHAGCEDKFGGAIRAAEQLSAADAASREAVRGLRDDNAVLRRDLQLQRGRTQSMVARIEEMERALASRLVGGGGGGDGQSASSAAAAAVTDGAVLPPIGQRKRDAAPDTVVALEDALEHGDVGARDCQLDKFPANPGRLLSLRNKNSEEPAEGDQFDELQSGIRAARLDNIILRQDLQSLHERESQLMRRNRDLEDKLLRRNCGNAPGGPASAEKAPTPASRRAELDINIDFTMPGGGGMAVISERDPKQKQKAEKKVATVPPLEKTTNEASFGAEDWKVTVSSKHKLDTLSTPKTVVVSPMTPPPPAAAAKLEGKPPPEAASETPGKAKAAEETWQKSRRQKDDTSKTAAARRERKPKKHRDVTTRRTAYRAPPLPAAALPPKRPGNDRFHDVIPKPGQFPCARPPRGYTPPRCPPTAARDLLKTGSSEFCNHVEERQWEPEEDRDMTATDLQ